MNEASTRTDAFWVRICVVAGIVICGAIAFLSLGPRPEGMGGTLDVSALPLVNASLNGATTLLLIGGVLLVRSGRIDLHRTVMLSAFGTSAAFLVSYVVYHRFKSGPKAYVGDFREIYLFILISHIVLAMGIVPLALITLYRGWNDQRERHRKIARITFPVWLYVSITGVVIYWMLY